MIIKNEYTNVPIEFNNLNQAQRIYVGLDSLDSPTLPKGKIITALTGPEKWMVGHYYTDYEELLKNDLDSVKLCQGVQVMPYYKEESGMAPRYKSNARIYVLNQDIKVASGNTTENCHFGTGGLQQYAIPNGKEMINVANEDEEIYNPKHSLIPIDLNTFQEDPRLSEDIKKELQQFKESVKGNISSKDGSVLLQNMEIAEEVYKTINKRTMLHETTAKYNCLMKEYVNELQKSDRDIEYIQSLKSNINEVSDDLNSYKSKLEQDYNILKGQPELMKEFTKHQQKHLLKVDTCCPQNTYQLKDYLEQKAFFLEGE